jgi:A/G-specific adenine glycosylase
MNISKVKIEFFEKHILEFYRKEGRKHLPWRKKDITLYEVWVSEIMLQQTQVDRVIDFYIQFLRKFPTVAGLARASWEEFLLYYQGLGYYNRGRNMLKTAKEIQSRYNGIFPDDIEILESLPGIGKYTARAIASFGSDADHLAWDTNFSRVFGRFFFGSKDAETRAGDFEGKVRASKRDFNSAIMDFGSLVCVKNPKCEICPLKARCVYFRERGAGELSEKKTGLPFPLQDARAWVFLHKDHKVYYSKGRSAYKPFEVPKAQSTREGIKAYFLKKYGLTISVRPPHKKVYIKGIPTMFINAQILLGECDFEEFTKGDINVFLKK